MNKRYIAYFTFIFVLFFNLQVSFANTEGEMSTNIIPSLPSTAVPQDNEENSKAVDPRQFGAKGDGITNDTSAIQQAISYCERRGGGIVILKEGTFLSSPLKLKDGVYLKIAKNAVLKAVSYADYPLMNDGKSKPEPLIGAEGVSHAGILGQGVIDGSGQDWWRTQGWQGEDKPKLKIPNQVKRPYLICFSDSSDIIVKDVTIKNSPSFNLVPQNCHNVVIKNVTIHNPANSHNTDGIDPSGTNIYIDGCSIDTGDDNIAIKGTRSATQNVYITNCKFYHGHGLSIGSDFPLGVQSVYAKNITFINTETAIRIKSARDRGGVLEDIHYSHITMQDVGKAIEITAYYPKIPLAGKDKAQSVGPKTPQYQNITIEDVEATVTKAAGGFFGLPERPIEGVLLQNVNIIAPRGMTVRNAKVKVINTNLQVSDGAKFIQEENGEVQ